MRDERQGRHLRVVLIGLEDRHVRELTQTLRDLAPAAIRIIPRDAAEQWAAGSPKPESPRADVLFCASDQGLYKRVLAAEAQRAEPAPVIVVSRCPDYSEWLDALEAGAHDYCAVPFEKLHLSWVLAGVLSAKRPETAAPQAEAA